MKTHTKTVSILDTGDSTAAARGNSLAEALQAYAAQLAQMSSRVSHPRMLRRRVRAESVAQ